MRREDEYRNLIRDSMREPSSGKSNINIGERSPPTQSMNLYRIRYRGKVRIELLAELRKVAAFLAHRAVSSIGKVIKFVGLIDEGCSDSIAREMCFIEDR